MYVTLQEILNAREMRVHTQNQMLKEHGVTLICFTMNIAGPKKNSPMIERAFREGLSVIRDAIATYHIAEEREEYTNCGPVFFCSLCANASEIKSAMVEIEQTHPIGRLFDIDVINADGTKINRSTERGCIVCGAPGRACSAGRLHPVAEIVAVMDKMMSDYFIDLDARQVSLIAKESLLQEVYTTPKPGLVDLNNNGSHVDMTVSDFERSALAIEPYFYKCFKLGAEHKNSSPESLFPLLRKEGLVAEKLMYMATNGANTHKGLIFSMGIIVGALGRLMCLDGLIPSIDDILTESANIYRPYVETDLKNIDGLTAGGRAYIELGAKGIRGEVADGFLSISNVAIPSFKKALKDGKNENDAGVIALLNLIAKVYDTNLYKRGGVCGLEYARQKASALIVKGEPTQQEVLEMDNDFRWRNLSPGGSADLLAITYFLLNLEKKR